jgi:energy-coupling factor transporter ATP-binding protein EcfA2
VHLGNGEDVRLVDPEREEERTVRREGGLDERSDIPLEISGGVARELNIAAVDAIDPDVAALDEGMKPAVG